MKNFYKLFFSIASLFITVVAADEHRLFEVMGDHGKHHHQNMMVIVSQAPYHKSSACLRNAIPRTGQQTFVTSCLSTEEQVGDTCFPKCNKDFETIGSTTCSFKCPAEFNEINDGKACAMPPTYGRGLGYVWLIGDTLFDNSKMFQRCEKDHGVGNCEQTGLVVYPKCRKNYHVVGCCLCQAVCPEHTYESNGVCIKKSNDRGLGAVRKSCPFDKEAHNGFCYDKCKYSDRGFGKTCWSSCTNNFPFDCGVLCTRNKEACKRIMESTGDTRFKNTIQVGGFSSASYSTDAEIISLSDAVDGNSAFLKQIFNSYETCF